MYIAFPYCLKTNPEKCGYCLFPSETYINREAVDQYLSYVRKEGRKYAEFMGNRELASIYFGGGGGTPNILKSDYYPKLIDLVKEVFPEISENIEFTLEGIPGMYNEEKLYAMKEAGINRISIGGSAVK